MAERPHQHPTAAHPDHIPRGPGMTPPPVAAQQLGAAAAAQEHTLQRPALQVAAATVASSLAGMRASDVARHASGTFGLAGAAPELPLNAAAAPLDAAAIGQLRHNVARADAAQVVGYRLLQRAAADNFAADTTPALAEAAGSADRRREAADGLAATQRAVQHFVALVQQVG